jgi:hypothetical protein
MIYIGQTVNERRRWQAHKSYAKNPEKTGQYIHRAIAKYGIENFQYEVIATCRTQEDASVTEIELIKQYDSRNPDVGYNLHIGGSTVSGPDHPSYGKPAWNKGLIGTFQHIEETKQLMSELHSGENNAFHGKTHSEETKAKMSAAKKGKPSAWKGKSPNEETRKKISEAGKGRKQSPETLAKRFSPEARMKMSEAKKGKPGNHRKIDKSATICEICEETNINSGKI